VHYNSVTGHAMNGAVHLCAAAQLEQLLRILFSNKAAILFVDVVCSVNNPKVVSF